MVNQAYPSVNDVEPSWSDITASYSIFEGQILDVFDFAGIKFSDKVEFGERRGASGGRRMARTTGSKSEEASAEFYVSGWRKLTKALAEKAPTRGNQQLISQVGFDITVQFTPPSDTAIYTFKITGCRIAGRDFDFKEGNEAQKVSVPLSIMNIAEIVDGKEIVLL